MAVDRITSRTNPTVKWLASLSEKKYRDESRTFLLDGEKLTKEAMSTTAEITHLILREDREDFLPLAEAYVKNHPSTRILLLAESCFSKITAEKSPQGVSAAIKYLDFFKYYYIIYKENFQNTDMQGVILLDGIQDPGNLGAILRSAAAFGVSDVILSSYSVDVYHPRVLRAAMGTFFHLRLWQTPDLAAAVSALRESGRRVLAAELKAGAVSVSEAALSPSDCIVIGNEGHGITKEVSAACNGSVYLPIADCVESLNASVAASLLIWEQMKGKESR